MKQYPDFQIARDLCWNCRRVSDLCLCDRLRPFRLEPQLVLLVHPKEARNSVGTARLVKLSVENSICWTGNGPDFDLHPGVLELISNPAFYPVVLFPGEGSVNLSRLSRGAVGSWLPDGRRLAIFVIDGTWSLARKMIRTSRVLSSLPRISFDVQAPSRYRFRRQPREYCLSTVEAIHLLIENLHRNGACALPSGNDHDSMLEAFDWLVETQLQFEEPELALQT